MQMIPHKKLLLHICCGPCAAFPVKFLREHCPDYTIFGYFYNPNIHPYQEFARRIEALKNFSHANSLELSIDEDYELDNFLRKILDKKTNRCNVCYETRLHQSVIFAKEQGFDAFTTTLLVSPYQNHELIKKIALEIAAKENIEFCYFDFRPGWQEGVRLSRELKLYRQPYCGCIFSEMERYYKNSKKE